MKRIVSVVLVLILTLSLMCGCKKESSRPFDYDISKYITLGDYVGIEYTYSVDPVTDEAVETYVNSALSEKNYGEEKTITDRAVKTGDKVNIAFEGKLDGKAFDGGSSESYDLVIGSNLFIEGFEDGLIGAKIGEKRSLNLKFPDNYGKDELNGKDVVFDVTVKSIKATVYPELTDAIVAEISDKKTVDEYMKYANEQVKTQNEQNAQNKMESDIWSKIISGVKVIDLPEKEVENYKKLILDNYEQTSQQKYGVSYEELLKAYDKTLEDIEPELVQQAEQAVKEYMTIVAIARAENLDITDEEYNKQLVTYAESNGYSSAKEFQDAIDESQFYLTLVIDKVMDFVVENATNVGEK